MKKGDVVMVVSGAPGLPAILAIDVFIHDGFVGFRELNHSKIRNTYFYYYLKYNKKVNDSYAAGAIFRNLTTDQIKNFDIPLPSLDEQERIVKILNDKLGIAQKTIMLLEKQIEMINKLPAALLRRAFNGEL